jgi:hypothetical protein
MASMGNAQRGALGGLAKLGEGARTTSDLSRVGGGLSRGANEGKKLNAAPWSDTFPAAGATLDLDFANNRGFVRGVGQGGVMDAITFTRASTGWYVGEDGLLQEADNGEPRFDWASTEQVAQRNLLRFTEEFDSSVWNKFRTTITIDAESAPNNTLTADLLQEDATTQIHVLNSTISIPIVSEKTYTLSVFLKKGNGVTAPDWMQISARNAGFAATEYANFDILNGVVGTVVDGSGLIQDAGNGWWRCIFSVTATSTTSINTGISINFTNNNDSAGRAPSYSGSTDSNVYVWGAQLEESATATEYQAVAQSTFTTPLRANPTSNGILIEEARTNRLLWNRDATQTQWVKTNITAAKDQTGIDGVANAASSLTATDDNGTCIQTITLAAGNRTGSVYLKRLTGTGNVQVTLDGSTYSTVELSDTEWYRIVLSGSVTNPTVGIKIAVDGDAVAMDYGQVEDGLFVTTQILTTTATATRAVDAATMSGSNFFSWFQPDKGTLVGFANGTLYNPTANQILQIDSGANANRIVINDGQIGQLTGVGLVSVASTNYITATSENKDYNVVSISYQFNDLLGARNGSNSSQRTIPSLPNVTQCRIAASATGTRTGTIKNIVFIPKFLPNAALEATTA